MPGAKRRQQAKLKRAANSDTTSVSRNSKGKNVEMVTADSEFKGIIKLINQVFSENQSAVHRLAAIEVMSEELENIDIEELHDHAINWIGHLLKAIEYYKELPDREMALCCHTLAQLLVRCAATSDLKRNISINVVPKLLNLLLSIPSTSLDVALIGSVNLMKICMKYFGGSCLSYKNKVEKYALDVVLNRSDASSQLSKVCYTTLTYLPCCGGQGSTGSKNSEMWTNQMSRLIFAVEKLVSYLYMPCGLPEKALTSEVPSGQEIPVLTEDATPENLTKAAHYISVYLRTVVSMLSTGFSWRVQLPVKHLLSIVCSITDVTPDSVVFRRPGLEVLMVYNSLSGLHKDCMSLLSSLAERCGTGLYPYRTTLCELLVSQLTWTQTILDRSPVREEQFITSRTQVYSTLCVITRQPGLHELLSGVGDKMIEHVLTDIHDNRRQKTPDASRLQPSGPKRPRQTSQQDSSGSQAISCVSDRRMMSSALNLLSQLMGHCAINITTRIIKLVYESLISLTLAVQDTQSSHSYSIDSELRLSLYQCLLATVYSYNREVGPLTHITTQLLNRGLQDQCSQVRSLCRQSLMVCQLVIQTRSSPLDENNPAFLPQDKQGESSEKMDTSHPYRMNGDGSDLQGLSGEVKSDANSSLTVTELLQHNKTGTGAFEIPRLTEQEKWSTASIQGSSIDDRSPDNNRSKTAPLNGTYEQEGESSSSEDQKEESDDGEESSSKAQNSSMEKSSDIVELVTIEEDVATSHDAGVKGPTETAGISTDSDILEVLPNTSYQDSVSDDAEEADAEDSGQVIEMICDFDSTAGPDEAE